MRKLLNEQQVIFLRQVERALLVENLVFDQVCYIIMGDKMTKTALKTLIDDTVKHNLFCEITEKVNPGLIRHLKKELNN